MTRRVLFAAAAIITYTLFLVIIAYAMLLAHIARMPTECGEIEWPARDPDECNHMVPIDWTMPPPEPIRYASIAVRWYNDTNATCGITIKKWPLKPRYLRMPLSLS